MNYEGDVDLPVFLATNWSHTQNAYDLEPAEIEQTEIYISKLVEVRN